MIVIGVGEAKWAVSASQSSGRASMVRARAAAVERAAACGNDGRRGYGRCMLVYGRECMYRRFLYLR